jgi:hypothetical protein
MKNLLFILSLLPIGLMGQTDTTLVSIRCSDTINQTLGIPFWMQGYEIKTHDYDPFSWIWPKNTIQVIYLDSLKRPLNKEVFQVKEITKSK